MIIKLEKFGALLLGRQLGKEAFLVSQMLLKDIDKTEKIEIDFKGVTTFTPSWGDEFLTPLFNRFGERLILKNTKNPSVQAVLEFLEKIHKIKFKVKK